MKRLVITTFAAVALSAAMTTVTAMLWSPSTKLSAGTAVMPSLNQVHIAAANKLPIEDFEDMSLVYSTVTMPAK
jgi:hypothetical protein